MIEMTVNDDVDGSVTDIGSLLFWIDVIKTIKLILSGLDTPTTRKS